MFRPVLLYHVGRPEGTAVRYSRACLPQSKGRRERRPGDRDQGEGAEDQKQTAESPSVT